MERKLLGKHGAALIIITVMVIAVLTAYKYTRAKTSLTAVVTSDGVTVLTLSLDEIAEKRVYARQRYCNSRRKRRNMGRKFSV